MKLLVDTHTLLWSVDEPAKISVPAMAVLQYPNNDRYVSAATIWELAIKVGLGKLTLSKPYRPWIEEAIYDLAMEILPVTIEYADFQATLPPHHKDPFDRMMISQSLVESIPIVTIDAVFDSYGVKRIW